MNAILNALARAFVSLLHPKMLWLMVWPVIVALVLWVTLAVLYWGEAAQWIAAQLHHWPAYDWAVSVWPLKLVAAWFGWILQIGRASCRERVERSGDPESLKSEYEGKLSLDLRIELV